MLEQSKTYAQEHGLTVGTRKNVFDDTNIIFKDKSGNIVREIGFVSDDTPFDDTYYTYDANGNVKTEQRYMADDGRYADTIEYFYDENGETTHSLKFNDAEQLTLPFGKMAEVKDSDRVSSEPQNRSNQDTVLT